jgi:hypothetical protein
MWKNYSNKMNANILQRWFISVLYQISTARAACIDNSSNFDDQEVATLKGVKYVTGSGNS